MIDAGPNLAGTFTAKMTANQSVPPTDAGSSGLLTIVSTNQNDGGYAVQVAGTLTGFGLDTATLVHIHSMHAGRNGPVLEGNLYPFTNAAGTVAIAGTQNFSQAAMQEIASGRTYVNVHTGAHPNGAVRGQILQVGQILWSAQLSGANEVPPTPYPSNLAGVGFIVNLDGGITYEGSWPADVEAVAAHIHDGGPGVNGPIVVPLTLIGMTATRGTLSTQQADAGPEQYVNVHTTDAGTGLIRGQIVQH